jgi:hypothetical protein
VRQPAGQHNRDPTLSPTQQRPFDVSLQHDQLLSQQRIFEQQPGFATGCIGDRATHQAMLVGFGPFAQSLDETLPRFRQAALEESQ